MAPVLYCNTIECTWILSKEIGRGKCTQARGERYRPPTKAQAGMGSLPTRVDMCATPLRQNSVPSNQLQNRSVFSNTLVLNTLIRRTVYTKLNSKTCQDKTSSPHRGHSSVGQLGAGPLWGLGVPSIESVKILQWCKICPSSYRGSSGWQMSTTYEGIGYSTWFRPTYHVNLHGAGHLENTT